MIDERVRRHHPQPGRADSGPQVVFHVLVKHLYVEDTLERPQHAAAVAAA